nr:MULTISPECIES: conjugal transfer protein [unclassified Allomuricauda]|tara:strand:+ start:5345 stop:5980 length:636 start_codon:yes stop_codon:yes gene_type:complete
MNFSKKNHEHEKAIGHFVSKSNIRTLGIALTLAILMPAGAACQGMPVYDNTNFITLGKQIIESAKQTSELLKTVEFLREQKERIEKVSDVIKQLKAVRELAKNNQRLFDMVRNDLREILNSPHIRPEEVERISESFNAIIENSLEDLEFVEQILSSDFLKMTDAERATVLKEKEMRSKEMVGEIQRKAKRYRDIISFREMQAAINNRKTNY